MFDTDALQRLPERPATSGLSGPPSYSLVAVAALLATAVLTGPGHDVDRDPAATTARAALPLAMGCRLEAAGAGEAALRIDNTTRSTLPAGSRIGWASSGTPHPVGGVLVLPQPLAAGDTLTLFPSQTALHASGCEARALVDGHDDLPPSPL